MTRRYHLQLPALLYIALAVLVGVAAANRPNNLLVWIFGLMIGAVLVSGIVSGRMMMGVRMVRLDPRHGRVGEPLVVRYAVANRNRFLSAFSLRVEDIPGTDPDDWSRAADPAWASILHVGPGETAHGEAVLWPKRRGRLRFSAVRVSSSFPFGLLRKSVTASQPQETLVHPRVVDLRAEILAAVAPSGAGGMRMSRQPGQGADYFGMREYRPGDSVRSIAWRRTATLDEPITVQRTNPSPPRLRVVLNLRRPTADLRYEANEAESPRDLEETTISLAASIIELADRHGYEVGLTVLGLPQRPTPLRRGHWHVQKLLGALAALDLDAPRVPGASATPDAERAGIVVVSPDRADPHIGAGASGGTGTGVLHLTARQAAQFRVDAASPGAGRPAETGGGSMSRRAQRAARTAATPRRSAVAGGGT
ncbi:MAG: DUF58 domain-containing protein [Phycisphaerales bacterium]